MMKHLGNYYSKIVVLIISKVFNDVTERIGLFIMNLIRKINSVLYVNKSYYFGNRIR